MITNFLKYSLMFICLFIFLVVSKAIAAIVMNILIFFSNLFLNMNEYSPGGNLPWDRFVIDYLIRFIGDAVFITLPIYLNFLIFMKFLKWKFNFHFMTLTLIIFVVIFFITGFYYGMDKTRFLAIFYLIPLTFIYLKINKDGKWK